MGLFERLSGATQKRLGISGRKVDLRDCSVLITGGSRGLGLELAREFGRRGGRVAICARDPAELDRAAIDLRSRDIFVHTIAADVRQRADVEALVRDAMDQLGHVDIIVNNAGTIAVAPYDALTTGDFEDAFATHFWAAYFLVEAVLPEMRKRKSGRIVNIASIGGRVSVPHLLPYSASKFALVGWSEGLRAELVRERVYVTTVIPGLMRTGSPENAAFKGRNRLEYAWFSIADSLPFVSVDVTAAAKSIVDATERGDAELTISIPAQLASIVHGVLPAMVMELMGIVARLLPQNGGIGSMSRRGYESHSAASPSPITTLNQRRAETQNEVPQP
jgi:short-subunit dehydrogenase